MLRITTGYPELQRIISHVDTTFRWGRYDRDPLPRWTDGRLALLGDAAQPMLPHPGQATARSATSSAVCRRSSRRRPARFVPSDTSDADED
jgi:2-polyprenyl-6-methoxyphenol hydroxylase-like FAD-dependent oxidoreductase